MLKLFLGLMSRFILYQTLWQQATVLTLVFSKGISWKQEITSGFFSLLLPDLSAKLKRLKDSGSLSIEKVKLTTSHIWFCCATCALFPSGRKFLLLEIILSVLYNTLRLCTFLCSTRAFKSFFVKRPFCVVVPLKPFPQFLFSWVLISILSKL